ncbi:hypothetical protein [Hyalangium sp.]|uniref:hypothetical protein n=1 Tax=Hyalangium sp. TaxID=2028555 RepID=UPI002D424AD6|nr:hypothetical protein [Hyalangium sp.]HYH96549.1 hypothetical protein [Hyalangium sp.]
MSEKRRVGFYRWLQSLGAEQVSLSEMQERSAYAHRRYEQMRCEYKNAMAEACNSSLSPYRRMAAYRRAEVIFEVRQKASDVAFTLDIAIRAAERVQGREPLTSSSGKSEHSPSGARQLEGSALSRAEHCLDLLADLLPPRIANEEIGDAVQVIHKMAKDHLPSWRIYQKAARTAIWVVIHTFQHWVVVWFLSVLKIAMGKSSDK